MFGAQAVRVQLELRRIANRLCYSLNSIAVP